MTWVGNKEFLMKGLVYREIRKLKKDGGDLYRNFADIHNISINDANTFLRPFLYGAGLSKIKPILTETEALELLGQYNNLYHKTVKKVETTNLRENNGIVYIRQGNHLVKVK
jgi:hypothetical protein